MDPRDFLVLLSRGWRFIVGATAISTAVALGYLLTTVPIYSSTAQIFVSTNSAANVQDLSQGSSFTQQVVRSYATVANQPIVLNGVREELGLDTSVQQLSSQVDASVAPDTAIIAVTAHSDSPTDAANLANSVGRNLAEVVDTLTPAEQSAAVKLTITQPALPNLTPSDPVWSVTIILALLAGVALGSAAVLARHFLDNRVRSSDDIDQILGASVLGTFAADPAVKQTPLVDLSQSSARAEAFRALRTNLQFVRPDEQRRVFVVTSALPSEGKSTTVINLAATIAAAGSRVLLIDADLRRPSVATNFGLVGEIGLTDVLARTVPFDKAVQDTSQQNLTVLPSGVRPPNPSELMQSASMRSLIDRASSDYDVVLIDAPPALPVTDAALIAEQATGVILLVNVTKVRRSELAHCKQVIERVGAPIVGVVLNMVSTQRSRGYDYGYRGEYGSVSDV